MFKPVMMGEFQAQILRSFLSDECDLPLTKGGSAVSNLVLTRLKWGMSTDVITLHPDAELPVQCFRSELVNFWVVRRRPNKCIRDGYREERKLIRQALSESDADVCHAHWTYEYGLSAVTQNIKPYVVTAHDHSRNILRWVGKPYLGQYLITQYVLHKAAGRLTAVSPYIAEYVSRISRQDVPVIPNIVPCLEGGSQDAVRATASPPWSACDRVAALDQSGQGLFTILTLADSGRLKNVKRALRAFRLLREEHPEARYQLAGAGLEPAGPIAAWARSNGLADGVDFLGWMSHEDALERVTSASVILHPSLEESFGMPVAEAMALGIPVIGASEAGGVRWLLNEECGWLVRGRSVDALASALAEVLSNPGLCRQKAVNADRRIQALCNPDSIIEQYEQVYEKALELSNI